MDVLAVVSVLSWLWSEPLPVGVGRAALVVAGGLLSTELTWRLERQRRQLADTPHVNMTSVVILAVTLLDGPVAGAAAAVVLYLHLWWRASRWTSGLAPYRAVFNTSAMIIPACAAYGVLRLIAPDDVLSAPSEISAPALAAAIATFWLVNTVIVGAAIAAAEHERSIAGLLGGWSANALEIVTLFLGAMTAVIMELKPWLALFFLPLVYVLHRSDSVKHLEIAASTDHKTGLLNMETWRCLAEAGLRKARRHHVPVAVLMLDLDFFKRINDTHGHLVGDDVLRAVSRVISNEVRRTDLVGRFGGEEFVVFLTDVTLERAVEIAERIRTAVAALEIVPGQADGPAPVSVRVTVGVACDTGYADDEVDLGVLLLSADNRLFFAKGQGRDRISAGYLRRAR
ncbi:GGDEF domain-containing protein [Amycolatopsis jejuensis]|uniref:GGDEF domain-containing protein n=1 Tax=Amycolatopsis jejuensis TaxID=330084 RepID=UPI00138E3C57|nr:GGDEF domain-containing protein [Amycolatopsis jejuensis]